MKNIIKIGILSTFIVLFYACEPILNTEEIATQTTLDNKLAEEEFNEVIPEINERGIKDKGVKGCASCGVVSGRLNGNLGSTNFDPDSTYTTTDGIIINRKMAYNNGALSSIIFTLDFNNISINDKLKTGVIQAVFIPNQGYTAELKGRNNEEFFISDGIKYKGKYKVENDANNQVTVKITDGECRDNSNAWTIFYASDRTTEIVKAGQNGNTGDETKFWGTVKGTNREGKKYEISTPKENPIIRKFDCDFIAQGIQITKEEGKPEQTMDFGYAEDIAKTNGCEPTCLLKVNNAEYILDVSKTGKDAIKLLKK